MADSRVVFEVIATAKGLKVVHKDLKKTSDETKKLAKNQDAAAKSGNKYHKQQKGIAQSNLSGAKGFSKMNETLGGGGSSGLVAAYATLAANVFAATAAFQALKKAAQIDVLIDSLEILGSASGKNLGALATQIREASGGAIDLAQAMQTASVGASAGFDSSQIKGLATVARQAALALGRDVGDAVDRLTRGAAKLEPEILDELGIFVRLDDAANKYATAIGKTANELSRFEKRQAFANEILDQGQDKFGKLGDLDASAFDRLGATLMDLAKNFTTFFNSVLGPIAGFLAQNQLALAGLIAVLTKGIITAALPMLSKLGSKMGYVAQQAMNSAQIQITANLKAAASYTAQLKPIAGTLGVYTSLIQKYRDGTITLQEQLKAEKILNDYILKNSSSRNAVVQQRVALAREELSTVKDLNKAKSNVATNKNLSGGGKAELNFANQGEKIFKDLDSEPGFKGFQKAFKKANKSGLVYRERMKRAKTETLIFGNSIPFLSKGLARGGIAFKSFGLTAKVAVKGIFTAIPVIGQVLLVVDLLIAGIKKLIGFLGGLIPEASELAQANKALANQLKFVEQNQKAATLATKNASDVIVMSGNATQELITATVTQATASKLAQKEANLFGKVLMVVSNRIRFMARIFASAFNGIPEAMTSISLTVEQIMMGMMHGIMNNMGGMIKFINRILVNSGVEPIEILSDKEQAIQIADLNKRIAENTKQKQANLQAGTISFFGPGALDALDSFNTLIRGAGPAAKELQEFLGGIENANQLKELLEPLVGLEGGIAKLPAKLAALSNEFDKNGDGILQTSEMSGLLNSAMQEGTVTTIKQKDAIEELREGFKNSSEQVQEFYNKFTKKGAISSFSGTIGGLVKQMNELSTGQGIEALEIEFAKANITLRTGILNGIQLTKKAQGEFNAEYAKAQADAISAGGTLTKQQFMLGAGSKFYAGQIKTASNAYNDLVKKIELAQIMDKSRLDILKQQETAVKKFAKLNLAATGAAVDLSNDQANINISRMEDELSLQQQNNALIIEKAAQEGGLAALSAEEQGKLATMYELQGALGKEKEKIIGTTERQSLLDQQTLNIAVKQLQASKALATSKAAELKATQMLAAAGRGEGTRQTPAEMLKAQITAKKNAIEQAKEEARIHGKRLEIELLITEARLVAAGITDTDLIDRIKTGMEELSGIQAEVLQQKTDTLEVEQKLLGLSEEGLKNMDLQSVKTTEAMAVLKTAIDEGGLKGKSLFDPEMMSGMNDALSPMREALKELGPEGELIAMAQEGILSLGQAFMDIGSAFKDGGGGMMAAAEAASQAIGVISGLQQQNTKAQVSEIDNQIEAEKKRDGKSKESIALIANMEKKKEMIQRKAFEQKKKMDIAQAVISTALGAARSMEMGGIIGPVLAAMTIAMGMAQIAIIKKQTFQGSSGAGAAKPSTISVGKRDNKVDTAQGASSGELSYLRGSKGIGSNANNFAPGGAGGMKKGYAAGGEILVGERGPELISPTQGGYQVTPNDKIGSGTSNVNFTINAVDAAGVQELLSAQRGNIIGMIREAANEHGEEFMESVNTEAY